VNKVEALVVDHLKDLGEDGKEFEVVKNFPCKKIGNMKMAKFSKFHSKN